MLNALPNDTASRIDIEEAHRARDLRLIVDPHDANSNTLIDDPLRDIDLKLMPLLICMVVITLNV
jgi:hypothetical protein